MPGRFEQKYGYAARRDVADDCQTSGLLRTAHEILWEVDSIGSRSADAVTVARYLDMCGPLYVCISLPIVGGCRGPPGSTAPFPALMDIDYTLARAG